MCVAMLLNIVYRYMFMQTWSFSYHFSLIHLSVLQALYCGMIVL